MAPTEITSTPVSAMLRIQPVDLDRDPGHVTGEFAGAPDRLGDASAYGHVVVLDQDGIVQPEAVRRAAAGGYRGQFQRAQARRGLARVRNARAGAGDRIDVGARERGDAAQASEENSARCVRRSGWIAPGRKASRCDRRAKARRRHRHPTRLRFACRPVRRSRWPRPGRPARRLCVRVARSAATASAGMVAWPVTSPRPPRSSANARATISTTTCAGTASPWPPCRRSLMRHPACAPSAAGSGPAVHVLPAFAG